MTDHAELIARAEASLEGVTDGPWIVTYERGNTHLRMGEKRDSQMCDETYYPWVPEDLNDWEFFAASRQNVPDLIAALKASEARVADAEAKLEQAITEMEKVDVYLTRLKTPGSEPLNSVNACGNKKGRGQYTAMVRNEAREFWASLGNALAALKGGDA